MTVHNIAFPSKKLSRLNQERNPHRSSTVYNQKHSKTAVNKYVDGFWCDNMDFFTGGSVMDSYFSWKQWFEVKTSSWICFLQTRSFWLYKMLTDGLEWCGVDYLWCFYQLFGLSFWRHPFTAEHPLVSKWWNATFLQIWWRNKRIYILDDHWVNLLSRFSFGWTLSSTINFFILLNCRSFIFTYT